MLSTLLLLATLAQPDPSVTLLVTHTGTDVTLTWSGLPEASGFVVGTQSGHCDGGWQQWFTVSPWVRSRTFTLVEDSRPVPDLSTWAPTCLAVRSAADADQPWYMVLFTPTGAEPSHGPSAPSRVLIRTLSPAPPQ